jgi:hypothetical protein
VKPGVAATAAVSAELFALAIATGFLAANNWFGAADLTAMVVWSLPLVLLVRLAFGPVLRRMTASPIYLRYLVLTLLGALLGIVWTSLVYMVLGGWIFAFSFPVLLCWVGGGLLAGVLASWMTSPKSWPTAFVLTSLTILALVATTAYANAPKSRVRVVLAPGLTDSQVQQFWEEVIGEKTVRTRGHSMRDGITGAGVVGYERGAPVIEVSLQRHLRAAQRDSVLAMIRRSQLVREASLVSENDNGLAWR